MVLMGMKRGHTAVSDIESSPVTLKNLGENSRTKYFDYVNFNRTVDAKTVKNQIETKILKSLTL